MKTTNNSRRPLSVPVVDIFIILLILIGITLSVVRLTDANEASKQSQYRVDLVIKDTNGNAMRVSNGTELYFDDGTPMGTAKLFGSSIYDVGTVSTYNASVLINAEHRRDALYCGEIPLLIGSEITLHSEKTYMTATVVSWSEIGDDN